MANLTFYRPAVSLEDIFHIDENLPPNEKAHKVFENLKRARLFQDALFLAVGKLLKITKEEQLYKYWDYDTFEQFIADEQFSFSREKAYMCMRVYEYYIEELQLDQELLRQVGISKLSLLLPIIKKEHPDVAIKKVEELATMPFGEFVREIKKYKDKTGKPSVFWSSEAEKWIVNYYDNTTLLISLGNYEKEEETDNS